MYMWWATVAPSTDVHVQSAPLQMVIDMNAHSALTWLLTAALTRMYYYAPMLLSKATIRRTAMHAFQLE